MHGLVLELLCVSTGWAAACISWHPAVNAVALSIEGAAPQHEPADRQAALAPPAAFISAPHNEAHLHLIFGKVGGAACRAALWRALAFAGLGRGGRAAGSACMHVGAPDWVVPALTFKSVAILPHPLFQVFMELPTAAALPARGTLTPTPPFARLPALPHHPGAAPRLLGWLVGLAGVPAV